MPGTSAMPLGRAGEELSAASIAHELKTPLAAIDAAGANLLAQLRRLLEALARLDDIEFAFPTLPMIIKSLSEAPPPLPLGTEIVKRIERIEGRLRASGLSARSAEAARRLVLGGWEGRVGEIAPLLAQPGGADLLDALEAAGRIRSSLGSLELSASRLEGLARALSPGAKPAAALRAGLTPSDVRSCAVAAVAILRHRIPEGVAVEIDAAPGGPSLEEPVKAGQILSNLVANALEAVPSEGGRIGVHCSSGSGFVTIRVEDNGPGIPEGLRDSLFAPYTTGRASGTGLGLFLARRMAEELGGSLILDTAGGGTAFLLRLPAGAAGGGGRREGA